jgi:hypothetical protein
MGPSLGVQCSTCGLTCGLSDQLLDGSDTGVPRLCLSYLARIWHMGWWVSW